MLKSLKIVAIITEQFLENWLQGKFTSKIGSEDVKCRSHLITKLKVVRKICRISCSI